MTIRRKLTLAFSAALIALVLVTAVIILSESDAVMLRAVHDDLRAAVEYDAAEVAYHEGALPDIDNDDRFIGYGDGVLEIDDDFRDVFKEVYTVLYRADGTRVYGTPLMAADASGIPFADGTLVTFTTDGVKYCLYDRALAGDGLDGLWVRGVVSEEREAAQLSGTVRLSLLSLPLLIALAVLGGYVLAGRLLRPIGEMSDTAAQIARGLDLGRRIDIGPGEDELHRLADAFNGMLDRVENAFEAQRRFTADVSHELRTPMSVIMAQCELALEERQTPEEYVEALEVVQRQGGRMSALISDMLDTARLERGAEGFSREPVDLSALTGTVCADMALLAEKGIVLRWETAEGVHVSGNRPLLTRLITNLIGNAYRYGRENGHIGVTLTAAEGEARLRVTDDGIGIAAQDIENIFHRFYQVDSSRASGGSGLGLAMARHIAAFHGGTLTAESELGRGSSFTFTVPTI